MRIADKLTINHLLSTEEIREFLVSTNSQPDALSIGAEVDYQNHVKYPYADFAKWLLDDTEDDGKTQLHRFGHLTLEQLESAYTTFKSEQALNFSKSDADNNKFTFEQDEETADTNPMVTEEIDFESALVSFRDAIHDKWLSSRQATWLLSKFP